MTSGSATLFLDAVLAANPAWQLVVDVNPTLEVDFATSSLLAKAHGRQLWEFGTRAPRGAHAEDVEAGILFRLLAGPSAPDNTLRAFDRQALFVCGRDWISSAGLPCMTPPPLDCAVLVVDGYRLSPEGEAILRRFGFARRDAITIPAGASFWVRSHAAVRPSVEKLTAAFAQSVRGNGMYPSQYFRVCLEILQRAPSNVLIFGAGADTGLYVQANAGGRTVVVEHHQSWEQLIRQTECEIVPVTYTTKCAAGLAEKCDLPNGFPHTLLATDWSVILVDSPEGHTDEMPGRQQSVYAAFRAASATTVVFLHDYDRALEQAAAGRYLGQPDEVIGTKPALAVFDHVKRHAERAASLETHATADTPMQVSVVIPTHNEGDWLERTVDSILSAQVDVPYEIIVVDDASDDGSVEKVRHKPNVTVVSVGKEPVGAVISRNLGAQSARGEYICLIDSHVIVHDHWLDYLRETSVRFLDRALVSGNILNSDHQGDKQVEREQYAFTLKDWTVKSAWHFHGHGVKTAPYRAPLCPAGLMFVRRSYFWDIGGFSECIKKWGGTDVEISLKNYLFGGENVVDPRVFIYHYFKDRADRKPTFSISYRQTFFNRLFIAKAFGSDEVYANAKRYLGKKAKIDEFVAEVESERNQAAVAAIRKRFVRHWDDFARDFALELKGCFQPVEEV
jgi:polypeptide N-acetylgalactosaminyltransferase